jgi:hypothetical protein
MFPITRRIRVLVLIASLAVPSARSTLSTSATLAWPPTLIQKFAMTLR